MADTPAKGAASARPLSPHLQIYRPAITMIMSIMHRVTGAALYFGTLILVVWLAAAASSPAAFDTMQWLLGTIVGQLVLFGYTWALFNHMLGGIRHFIWDTGAMLEKATTTRLAWLTLVGSLGLTFLVWVVGYIVWL